MVNDNERKATIFRDGRFYKISFVHPLKRTNDTVLNHRKVKQSLKIEVKAEADKVGAEIDAIIQNPKRWHNVGDVSDIVRSLWSLDLEETPKPQLRRPVFHDNLGPIDDSPTHDEIIHQNQMQILRDVIRLKDIKISELEAELKIWKRDSIESHESVTIENAVASFLASGTNASKRKLATYRGWLNRFALENAGIDCYSITPAVVVAHLLKLKAQKTKRNKDKVMDLATLKQIGRLILALMRRATKGTFKPFEVQEIIDQKETKEEKRVKGLPLWLDENEWNELIGAMENKYVASIANLSFWSGFRPEELPFLKQEDLTVDEKGDTRIEVCDMIDNNGNVFWSPKTPNSYDKVHIHAKALDSLRTLQDAFKGASTFFPCCKETNGKIKKDGFRKEKSLWTHDSFTDMFLAELRNAWKKLGWSAEAMKKLDSRTPRRSCGKREYIATKSITHVALILRDTEDVVREHYARLIATDTRLAD